MRRPGLPGPVRTLLLSGILWRALPTPATLYFNHERLREATAPPQLPNADWSRRERRALLDGSEGRLRNIEAKGPGAATVSAVILAAVLVAISTGWGQSATAARVLLALAALYTVLSLLISLYLVGPVARDTVDVPDLIAAAASDHPEETLAKLAAMATTRNDLRNVRLSNLLDAARRELSYALVLVVLWALLVPVTGVMRQGARPKSQSHHHLTRPGHRVNRPVSARRADLLRCSTRCGPRHCRARPLRPAAYRSCGRAPE